MMSFNPVKTPIEIIKEGAFGGTTECSLKKVHILVLMVNGIVIVGKSLNFYVMLILNYI